MPLTACFGEILLRLTPPGHELPLQSPAFSAHLGGAEANVAVALASLGHPSRMISAVPPGSLGQAALRTLRGHGVDVSTVQRRGSRLGLYYLEHGSGLRASSVSYDRAHSAFAEAPRSSWDWDEVLAGCAGLHVSGISPALGRDCADAVLDAVAAARTRGMRVSFDGNFRAQLWKAWDSDPSAILRQIISGTDLLFGNHKDVSLLLNQPFSGEGSERRRAAAEAAFEAIPTLEMIASTARHVESAGEHRITARIDKRDSWFETEACAISGIVDRIGTGDAFAAGILSGVIDGLDLEDIAARGLALNALKHSLPGDFSTIDREHIDRCLTMSLDVQR